MFCYTDNPEGITKNVNIIPYIENGFDIVVFNKLFLFSSYVNEQLPQGKRVFFDLDLVIKSNIDDVVYHERGDLCLIEAEWRDYRGHGFPMFYHPFNSSCMTWSDNSPQKMWDHIEKDPEYFMTKYRWGMDSVLFYEKDNIGLDIRYFPPRKFYSFLYGVDIAENSLYDPKLLIYRESKLRHITKHVPIVLFNGPTTPEHYNHFFYGYYRS